MKFKQIAILLTFALVSVVLIFGCISVPIKTIMYEPGTYEGSGRGFRGPISVRIVVSKSGIEDIEILDHSEDESIGGGAIEELRELILEYGILPDEIELDAVSGATASCKGFLAAIENALFKAQ